MHAVPECLSRRYNTLDNLINEIDMNTTPRSAGEPNYDSCDQQGLKLMCQFWNILKENPDCDLKQAVQQRLGVHAKTRQGPFPPQSLACYRVCSCSQKLDIESKQEKDCCKSKGSSKATSAANTPCSASRTDSPEDLPLTKALCNLKEAAFSEKKCLTNLNELMATEEQLKEQIQKLEQKELEGLKLLKKADCMWSCMEEEYKKKLEESSERMKISKRQLKEAEASTNKWKKTMKDLESQLRNVNKYEEEVKEKIKQKNIDMKTLNVEIENIQKRLENSKKEIEAAKKSIVTKKESSDKKIETLAEEVTKLEKVVKEENKIKQDKEDEGAKFVKEARDDLQKICGLLIQKKLENEDMNAEKNALLSEIDVLKQTRDQCKEKCKKKRETIEGEIKKLNKEIAEYQVKCTKCNVCTETCDLRSFCTDCPRCLEERKCLYDKDHCEDNHALDCVCMSTKRRFLDNVFENMYTVLDKKIKKSAGRTVADKIFECLKRSRNGKLDEPTRKILQDFILAGVKKNLNLTIIGGAVKTRCEMEPDTYKQLMLCLQKVKATEPEKADKGTAKKACCRRWGGTGECFCPKGPENCACTKKTPSSRTEQDPCDAHSAKKKKEDQTDAKGSSGCGQQCGMPSVDGEAGKGKFSKSMRTAACVLGSESTSSTPTKDSNLCDCGISSERVMNGSGCKKFPRERLIEEVMGKYEDTTPFDDTNIKQLKPEYKPYVIVKNKGTCLRRNIGRKKQCASNKKHKTNNNTKCQGDILQEITKTASGTLVMTIHEDVVKLIEDQIKRNSCLNLFLEVTESGNLLLELDSLKNTEETKRKLVFQKILFGCMIFKGNVNAANILEPNIGDKLIRRKKASDQNEDTKPNAFLKRTSYGVVFVIATKPDLNITALFHNYINSEVLEQYFKVNILDMDNTITEVPGVLQSTPSRNYIIKFDKEFEKTYQETVNHNIKGEDICGVTLNKSEFGHIIKINSSNSEFVTHNALLKKTKSGNLKLLMKQSSNGNFNEHSQAKSFVSFKNLSRSYQDLLQHIPKINSSRNRLQKAKYSVPKSQQDSQFLLEVGRDEKIPQGKHSSVLKKSFSGIYAALNESSKITIIDNLNTNLFKTDSTKSDDMKINLGDIDTDESIRLKLEQSDSVGATDDVHIIKCSTKVQSSNHDASLNDFNHIPDKVVDPVDEATSAKRSSKIDNNSWVFTKCICDDLSIAKDKTDNSPSMFTRDNEHMQHQMKTPLISIEPGSKLSYLYRKNDDNALKCSNNVGMRESKNSRTICDVESSETNVVSKKIEHKSEEWDSLNFLPPQLPPFLGDITNLYN